MFPRVSPAGFQQSRLSVKASRGVLISVYAFIYKYLIVPTLYTRAARSVKGHALLEKSPLKIPPQDCRDSCR